MVISREKAPKFCLMKVAVLSNAGSDGTQPEAKVDKAEELMERLKEDAEGVEQWWELPFA